MDSIRQWLNTCENDKAHHVCRRQGEGWAPTRLLHIISRKTEDPETVRVVRPDVHQPPKYAALSHCWGGIVPLKLETATSAELQAGIAIYRLPRTFRNAVSVAHALGVEYLWIDSLAIQQDSEEDWQREAMRMQQVYENAHFTIAVTAAKNSSEGLLFKRIPSWLGPLVIDLNRSIQNHALRGSHLVMPADAWNFSVDSAPLNHRAWVVQERRLSRRIIHFTRQEVFLECRHSKSGEAYRDYSLFDWVVKMPLLGRGIASERLESIQSNLPVKRRSNSALAEWVWTLDQYSGCEATFEKDRLIAFAGYARSLQNDIRAPFLAGLWQKDLIAQLVWRRSGGGPASERPTTYYAPTWSWASMKGQIETDPKWMGHSLKEYSTTLLSAQVTNITDDQFSAVKSGTLKLKGPVAVALARPRKEGSRWIADFSRGLYIRIPSLWCQADVYLDRAQELSQPEFFWLVVSAEKVTYTCNPPATFHHFEGLLLSPVPGRTGVYRREGMLRFSEREHVPSSGCWGRMETAVVTEVKTLEII